MQTFAYIFLIGAAQGVVLAFALWRKAGNHRSNRLMAVWLFLLSFDLIMKVVYLHDRNTPLISLYRLIQFFPFFYGSFFFLYVRTLIKQQPLRWGDGVHFLGFVAMLISCMPWILNLKAPPEWYIAHFELLLYSYSVSYVLVGVWLVHRYRRDAQAQLSDLTGVDLTWLLVLAYGQIVIWGVAVAQWLLPWPGFNFWYIYVAISVWMVLIGYLALQQDPIVALEPIAAETRPDTDERLEQAQQKLTELMQDRQLFLEPSLTIKQVATQSGYPEYLISQVLNRIHEQSFHQHINQLRIEHAKTQLADVNNANTILDIAYASGYTAKSTFNTAFKRFVGQTPSEYRRQCAAGNA